MTDQSIKRVLVTGGAGYVGSVLTPKLLDAGYEVVVFDIQYFGDDTLPKQNPKLTSIKGDLRDSAAFAKAVAGCDAVIHLACISNDPSFILDPNLSKSINYDCFEPMVVNAKQAGVKRFVYASTSSVYGVSEAPDVTEDHPLVPLTDYNKFKGMCEPLLWKHISDDFIGVTIRPATVCGYGPRMRLDLSVNILTNHAVNNGKITVFGGSQLRPNIHVEDVSDLYVMLLGLPGEKIQGETFNAGYQNMSISDIALAVKSVVEEEFPGRPPIDIVTTPTDDIRSYHVNSDKIRNKIGFQPKRTVEDAVRGLCQAFRDGKLPNSLTDDKYFNVKTMQKLTAA
ncbi:SDR family oxidoreductase [Thalassobaculum sp.]|jgi:nucleoside-diphosphate-sugar epimerase|uniref:NAD-dependent epimerase/dehydratase family protein n=1 Tax=Thalassobaculum sp. TaxID=2022740 RepID=UPI00015F05A8|nr:NAD-dependent epimerase/dehydratase [alpha proteobacterium BAL199]